MIIHKKAGILENTRVGENIFHLTLDFSYAALPGQFYLLKLPFPEPLLARPFSVFELSERSIGFLYQTKGVGTNLLSAMAKGEMLTLTGPLGNGWQLPNTKEKVALIGGGIGLVSLNMLTREINSKNNSEVDIYLGFSKKPFTLESFSKITHKVVVSSEGKNEPFLQGKITEFINPSDYDTIYACGPRPMLKTLYSKVIGEGNKNNKPIDLWVSLEEKMACGIGSCWGCVVKVKGEYKRVCRDGPVFNAREVDWDEYS
ncbi:MAG: Dihydroorotate dehydrogenase B (NAD(+)), electron transfer subunit [candidate division WS2 bacterium]|uniref:Dihydroorotate dehydrogenase B (NAD(+)), electron transfer subunit n=1 Tax=Psychracetigena formicireducens TaxID=2986056 RepID=A0A9E2BGU2_PSYF1|nr:Dihydroorotate dehydrogenase B (NAD(+)), electron transfer subunit [Candidatus Psychracetigena formicireducens]MBT9145262.1 Dihydroorotate dehydrogenase B (NAD(+)), electron transfer subunit [Candidatus Psychracetigena formicireducens]